MKFSKISVVLGLMAVAGFSSQALALNTNDTPSLVVNISGASAQQKTLGALLSSFCAGNLHTYLDDPTSGSDGKKWRSYFCTLDENNPSIIGTGLEGKDVLFNNRSGGGSIWGVVPVAREWAVEYLNIFEGSNCTLSSGDETSGEYTCTWDTDRATGLVPFTAGTNGLECPFVPYSAGTSTYVGSINAHTGTTAESTVCLKSDGGVSDVEPALFVGNNFPGFTGGALSTAEQNSLTVLSEYGVIFGISVTESIYEAMQAAQGLAPLGTGDDATRPSMSSADIATLLSGGFTTGGGAPEGNFGALDSSLSELTAGFMAVCRRVVGSGTQAAQNAFFMGDPCLGNSGLVMVSSPGAPALLGDQIVVNNSGSGDVIDCQNDAESGALAQAALGTAGPVPVDAIGFNAIEKQPGATDTWDYVKIDGVDPTVANAISGDYRHWFEQTIQWPTASTSGDVLAALNVVATASGDPAVMTSAGLSGVAALPSNGFDWETTSPTMRGGRGGDSCKPVVLEADD